jgi:hypothetical protein
MLELICRTEAAVFGAFLQICTIWPTRLGHAAFLSWDGPNEVVVRHRNAGKFGKTN